MQKLLSREEELKKVIRRVGSACKPMLYTPDLWTHVQRVEWNTKTICEELLLDNTLVNEGVLMARYHDDEEIVTGDVLTPEKDKWTQEERTAYEDKCQQATQILISQYGGELSDDYSRILKLLETPKAEQTHDIQLLIAIVDYADKFDAHMEVCHEIYAGGINFVKDLKGVHGYDGHVFGYTIGKITERKKRVEKLLGREINTGLLDINARGSLDIHETIKIGVPHTLESIQSKTGDSIYDMWIQNHFQYGNDEQIKKLYEENKTV